MLKPKTLVLLFACFVLAVTAACAPAAPAQPTTDAAMMKATDAAMMMQATDTAMMAKSTSDAAMMKATDTAMMMKATDTAMMMHATDTAMMAQTPDAMAKTPEAMMPEFPQQQFAAHFVDSMPMHMAMLDKLPPQVVLDFNFTLSDASTITIEKDGKELKSAAGMLGDKKLSMTTELPADAGAGLYLVKYKACWPDNSCHNGQFAFLVK